VFENRVLRIFWPKRDEVTGDWRKLHNEELNDMYLPNIVRVIKSRRIRWAESVACMGKNRGVCSFCWGNLRERHHLEDPDVGGKIMLGWIFRKWGGVHGLDRFVSVWGQVACTCKRDNEPSDSIKCGEFVY